jgi:hypothetical protein
MRLPFCGCGHPLWTPASQERGFCEHCRLHHCVHWPEFGYHPRALPEFLPSGGYENPYRKADAEPVPGFNLVRDNGGTVIHRHTCPTLTSKQVPWVWANTAELGAILYATAYFGYETCLQCHPFARVVLHP